MAWWDHYDLIGDPVIKCQMLEDRKRMHGRTPREQVAYECGVADAKEAKISRAIDAKCFPPPTPEIVVTEKMLAAGVDAFLELGRQGDVPDICKAVYRAMRVLEPDKE